MRKILIIVVALLFTVTLSAKKVKFATDMTGQAINSAGIHITGSFQLAAGFPADWESNTTPLTLETGTNIYSTVVDIPAFAEYEYKFVNGDMFYDVEFVPIESRVNATSNDNRWIYIDSLANDTTFVGAIIFAANAPVGYYLLRFKVDMLNTPVVNPAGVHVAGTFQNWDPLKTILYSFDGHIYEYIAYVDTNTVNYEFKYINGNTAGDYENVPLTCAFNNNRGIAVPKDTVLDAVCFGGCSACSVGIEEGNWSQHFSIAPNPINNFSVLRLNDNSGMHDINICDISDRVVRSYLNYKSNILLIGKENLIAGIYFLTIRNENGKSAVLKLIIE